MIERENTKTKTKEAKFYMIRRCAYVHGQLNEQRLSLTNQMNALTSNKGEFSRKTNLSKASPNTKCKFSPNPNWNQTENPLSQTKGSKIQSNPPTGAPKELRSSYKDWKSPSPHKGAPNRTPKKSNRIRENLLKFIAKEFFLNQLMPKEFLAKPSF